MVADGPLKDTDSITSGYTGALREPRDVAELARLLVEDGDEFRPDGLALDLGIRDIR
jgi:hypothetical protein